MEVNINNEAVDISWDELFLLTSGRDQNGVAVSAASLSIETVEENPTATTLVFGDGVVELYHKGGCTTVTILIQPPDYETARKAIEEIKTNKKDLLSMMIVPYFFKGEVVIVLSDIVYAELFSLGTSGKKLVVSFNHEGSQVFATENSDYEQYIKEFEAESAQMESELMKEIQEAEAEKQAALDEMNPLTIQLQEARAKAEAEAMLEGEEVEHD